MFRQLILPKGKNTKVDKVAYFCWEELQPVPVQVQVGQLHQVTNTGRQL